MKTIKELRNKYGVLTESVDKASSGKPVTISDVPTILVFKRRAVRMYPGGRKVGLYYSHQIDKFITIPYGEAGLSLGENIVLDESYQLDEVSDKLVHRAISKALVKSYPPSSTKDQKKGGKSAGKLAAALYYKKKRKGSSTKDAMDAVEKAGKIAGRYLGVVSRKQELSESVVSGSSVGKRPRARRKTGGPQSGARDFKNTLGKNDHIPSDVDASAWPKGRNSEGKKPQTVEPEHRATVGSGQQLIHQHQRIVKSMIQKKVLS